MAYINSADSYVFLTCEEAYILKENLLPNTTYNTLFDILEKILNNTQDEYLAAELSSLINKLKNLTISEFNILKSEIGNQKTMYMPTYTLPHIE